MQLHFIVNKSAGNGLGIKKWHWIQRDLKSAYTVHETSYNGHAKEIACKLATLAAEKMQEICIIAIGGDGTVNEVINGIASSKWVILGVCGAGSGNDFIRAFPSFTEASEIDRFISNPQMIEQDFGVIHWQGQERIFINNSGVGFDAYVANSANESILKKKLNRVGLGKLSYIYYVIVGLFKFKPYELIVVDGAKETVYNNVWFATVSNQPYFGGGMKLSPNSKMNDGQLEITIVHNLARWKFLSVFGTVFLGKHTRFKEVKQFAAQQIIFKTEGLLPVHTDGEKIELAAGEVIQFEVQQESWRLAK